MAKAPTKIAETAAWVRSIRMNSYTLTVLVMILVGVFMLAPGIQTWFTYRQQIADFAAQVDQAKKDLANMTTERKRWDDPVYIRSQARDRLYYVLPGEVSYLVMDAGQVNLSDKTGTVGQMLAEKNNNAVITKEIRATKGNWVDTVLGSVIRSGIEEPAADATN